MINKKRIYITILLLSIYVSYFGSVSLFVHSHIFNGVLYIHSHPYHKTETKTNQLPIEAHHHTINSFFTLNQVSGLLTSGSIKILTYFKVLLSSHQFKFNEFIEFKSLFKYQIHFDLRAPPALF